jgi:hypothetical protein
MPRIARAVGLGGGDGSGVVGKLPQVLAELAQKVLCGLCRSALHDQTLQLGPLFLDPLAGLRQPFLDAVGADGLYHGYLQPQPPSDPGPSTISAATLFRAARPAPAVRGRSASVSAANASVQGMPMPVGSRLAPVGTRVAMESFRRIQPQWP